MRHVRSTAAVVALVAMLVASCGGGDEGSPSAEKKSTTVAPSTTAGPASGPAVPSPGCGTSTTGAVDSERRTLDIEGTERWYLLTTPEQHDGGKPLPLVLDFHGLVEGAEIHSQMSQYATVAKEKGFVVAIPHGSGEPVHWNANPAADPNEDLTFVDTLLDTLGNDLCLDTSRVYATGLSDGAIMTSMLMCARADRFAAAALVAGVSLPEPCTPSRPMPMVVYHGTADPILLFNGGVGDLSMIPGAAPQPSTTVETTTTYDLDGEGYPDRVATWAERNGCDPEPVDTELTPEVVHRVYDCPEGADVEFYIVIGGGHSWPSSEFSKSIESVVGHTTFDVDATRQSWEFFQRFQL